MRLEVWRSNADSQWYIRTIADNGETLNTSEGHVRRIDAVDIANKTCPPGATIVIEDN